MEPNIKIADKKFKAAKQNLTTGIFQWSKDYTSAATNFSQAVKYYQLANQYQKVLLTLKELITCNQKLLEQIKNLQSNWAVARNYQQMLEIYLNYMPQIDAITLIQTAKAGFLYFKMADSIDKGIIMLKRVAKQMIKKGQSSEGVKLLKQAYNAALQQEKSFKRNQLFHQIIQVYMQLEIYSQTQKLYLQEIRRKKSSDCAQNGLIIVILILIQQQPKRAEKTMYELSNQIPNFLQTDECEAADELIKAYKKGDLQLFIKWTTKAPITSIFPTIIIQKVRGMSIGEENNAIEKLLF